MSVWERLGDQLGAAGMGMVDGSATGSCIESTATVAAGSVATKQRQRCSDRGDPSIQPDEVFARLQARDGPVEIGLYIGMARWSHRPVMDLLRRALADRRWAYVFTDGHDLCP